ncbi:MAG: glycosyltransferase family 2 protein [Sphingobacteriales bacterium]|nr:MAG: glycosyltransferase family 2 protein [Sphingobacteriales bacterium]
MKISGFTIIKNAVINDYPIVEAIQSILPVVDEMIVSIGDSEDSTEQLIQSINSPKIKIVHSVWDPSIRKGGKILAVETDKAMQHISPDADWAFYIQGDEVLPEQYQQAVRAAAEKYKDDKRVDGLLFKYLHFYGSYDYVGDSRKWYNYEIRVIKNDKTITAYKDAQGFRRNGKKIKVKVIDACIYHYGWVKTPAQMKKKMKEVSRFWNEDTDEWRNFIKSEDVFGFDDYDSLALFTGKHPAVMENRIKNYFKLDLDIKKKNFSLKNRLLYWFEKKTGIRPFSFKNYRII